MKFSIIIPVYNCSNYLCDCIDSILDQDFNDYEILLVDDGSFDGSESICDNYRTRDKRVKVIHKKNQGVAIARKVGCDNAKGDYFIFVDSDDWLDARCLRAIQDVVNKYDADIVYYGTYVQNADGIETLKPQQFKGLYDKTKIEKEVFPFLIHDASADYFHPSLCGGVFRREIISPYMIDNGSARIGEDSACIIPAVFHSKKIFFISECFYHYRYNEKSATKGKTVFLWDNPKVVANHIKKSIDLDRFDFSKQLDRRIVHDIFNVCVTQYYRNEQIAVINNDIKRNLDDPFYNNAIHNAVFCDSFKAELMQKALKHRWLLLIRIYSKMKELVL